MAKKDRAGEAYRAGRLYYMARCMNVSRIINPADAGFSLCDVLDVRAAITVVVFYPVGLEPLRWFAPLDLILFDLAACDAAALM